MKKTEKKSRSVIKGITYRCLATLATFTLAYVFTGDLTIATEIGFLDFFIKFAIYYANERVWNWTSWGYQKGVADDGKQMTDGSLVPTAGNHLDDVSNPSHKFVTQG